VESERDASSVTAVPDRLELTADPLETAANASVIAAHDAAAAAASAADTALARLQVAQATAEVVRHAKVATAAAVAATAASTARIAAQSAAAVEAVAVAEAVEAATSAEAARCSVAAELPDESDPEEARRAAVAVAATVAADVVARSKATAGAAALVAQAVTAAVEAAFVAAQSEAATVELAAEMAAASGRVVAVSSAATHGATALVVESTGQVAELAPQLRAVAALRRVTLMRDPLVAELQGALVRHELRLHYQPIYKMQTGALSAVEALLRWQHPTRGLLQPAEFLDVAESHPDLVTPVGDWVLTTAVSRAREWWRALGSRAPKLWINISCDQLGQQHVPDVVERLLTEAHVAPAAIGLEVTERQLIRKADESAADLGALRDLGVALAVDDFGTGYASLDYLRRFTFDEIKIDSSFVAGLGEDRTDTAVTASIVALGQALDMTVVAEGVETQEQYDRLKGLGCAMSQGYLMARPAPARDIVDLLNAQWCMWSPCDPAAPARRTRRHAGCGSGTCSHRCRTKAPAGARYTGRGRCRLRPPGSGGTRTGCVRP